MSEFKTVVLRSSSSWRIFGCFLVVVFIGLIVCANLSQKGPSVSAFTEEAPPQVSPQVTTQDLLQNNLEAWDTWLGSPDHSISVPGLPPGIEGERRPALGWNNDPKAVFSVVRMDGKPTLRISGEITGGITTKEVYENYHLSVRILWGDEKWPSIHGDVKDSGILVHCHGEPGQGRGFWMKSVECQLREWQTGDLWMMETRGKVRARQGLSNKGQPITRFTPSAPLKITSNYIIRHADTTFTKKWNKIEVFAYEGTVAFVVNGGVTMIAHDVEQKIRNVFHPLRKGKIQLQSGGAEIFFQDIEIRSIDELPRKIQLLTDLSETKEETVGSLSTRL